MSAKKPESKAIITKNYVPSSGDIFSWAGDSLLKQLGSGGKGSYPGFDRFPHNTKVSLTYLQVREVCFECKLRLSSES